MAGKECNYNPFENVSILNNDDIINDEDFMSASAAAELFEADKDYYVFGDTTIAEVRNAEDTFQNMTVGGYFRMRSHDPGSASFLQLMNESVSVDKQGDDPACSLNEVDSKSPAKGQTETEPSRHSQEEEEPQSVFSNSIFLKMDESIPHSPPSFLQNLDSSIFGSGGESSSTERSSKSNQAIFDSIGLERDDNNPMSNAAAPSTSINADQSGVASSGVGGTSSRSNHVTVTAVPGSNHEDDYDNGSNYCNNANDNDNTVHTPSFGNAKEISHFMLSSAGLSVSTSAASENVPLTSNKEGSDLISVSSSSSSSSSLSSSSLISKDQNQKRNIPHREWKRCDFEELRPMRDGGDVFPGAVAMEGRGNGSPPPAPAPPPLPLSRESLLTSQCPPNMSSHSMLLGSNNLTVDDEEWDFTLSDVNQLVEGMDDMDLDAVFAQVVSKKKEKIKQQKIAAKKQKGAKKTVINEHSVVHHEMDPQSVGEPESVSGLLGSDKPSSSEIRQSVSVGSDSSKSPLSLLEPMMSAPSSSRISETTPANTAASNDDVTSAQFSLDDASIAKLMESMRPLGRVNMRGGNDDGVGDGVLGCGDSSVLGPDDSLADGVTLLCDNNNYNETVINNHTVVDFAASTPMFSHRPHNVRSELELLRQSAIHHLVTPHSIQEMLDLPRCVGVPEVCCVLLSQQVQFSVRNKLRAGIQCTFTISMMALNGKVVDDAAVCPFDFNRRITICPHSAETVQVLFAPTCAGHFFACMEVTAQNLTNPRETRTYEVNLTGQAEFPKLKVLPNSEEIDFGELNWGSSDHKTIKVQNVGQATVPVRFTVIRTNSPLCTFTFQSSDTPKPNNLDRSLTSMTGGAARPPPANAVNSVVSVPLVGVREGEQPTTHFVDVYCHIKAVDTNSHKYSEACEVFEGVLSMELDSLLPSQRHLTQFRLRVRVGMVKLHLDKSALILSTPPGRTKEGTVKVVNSGNISMKVSLDLDPPTDLFYVSPRLMVVEPHAYQLARVSFTPQDHSTVDVNIVLSDQLCINFLPVKGQTKQQIVTKINANASSMVFGGVPCGEKISKTLKFSLDQDVDVKCFIRHGISSSFQIALDNGTTTDDLEISMIKGVRFSLHVVFIPEEVKWFSSMLVLQVIHGDSFSIPLMGYGGVSTIKFTGLMETKSGESVISVGGEVDDSHSSSSRTPFTHTVTVTNMGDRCAFVKAVFQDKLHNVMSPHQATVMPSELFLAPRESRDLVIWMLQQLNLDKPQGRSGMSLKGIVKLFYGDEINRELLCRNQNSECQRLALNYILELTGDQKTRMGVEMQDVPGDQTMSANAFKSSVRSKKIGLLTGIDRPVPDLPRTSDTRSAVTGPGFGGNSRPVLQTVNFNVQQQRQQQQPTKMDKEWTLSPDSISFRVLDARSKEFAQIINYTEKALSFSVETDDCLRVVPTKGVVSTKSWSQLELTTSGKFWSSSHKPTSAVISVRCNDQIKHIQVVMEAATIMNMMTFPPVFTALDTVSAESLGRSAGLSKAGGGGGGGRGQHLSLGADEGIRGLSSSSTDADVGKSGGGGLGQEMMMMMARSGGHHGLPSDAGHGGSKGVFGPGMAIIPPVSLGGRSELSYVFTNTSQEIISWKAVAVGPLSCEPAPPSHGGGMESSVFSPHPQSGTLEAGGVQTMALGFTPLAVGSYKQAWGIEHFGVTCCSLHTFTIYAKANSRESQSGTGEGPTHLSPRRQQQLRQHHHHQHHQHMRDQQASQQPSHSPPRQQHAAPVVLKQLQARPETVQMTQVGADNNFPKWTSCQQHQAQAPSTTTTTTIPSSNPRPPPPSSSSSVSTTASSPATTTTTTATAAAAQRKRLTTESGDKTTTTSSDNVRCLQLLEKTLRYPALTKGRSDTLYLKLSNTSPRDADITVEQQPGAPFIIRHTNFTVRKDRMTKLPVVFKPLHVAKFRQQVVLREKQTNTTFTALLEAECIP